MRCLHRTELGYGDRSLAQQFEEERLKVVVGTIDFVNEQHRRSRAGMA